MIRKALEPHPILLTEGNTVQINPDLPLWLDVDEFEQQAARFKTPRWLLAPCCLLLNYTGAISWPATTTIGS
ncbi:MAG: hypothetical protein ACUVWZ_07765 [Anaerolineae bacterium]